MKFTKMHGLGNDFVVLEQTDDVPPELVRHLCDRRFGIGADGVLTASLDDGQVLMGYWNADGSPAEMCGNGLRCVARYAHDRGWMTTPTFDVATPSGLREVTVHPDGTVTAAIGSPELAEARQVGDVSGVPVRVGNPHVVVHVVDVESAPVEEEGRRIEREHGTNVEFVAVVNGALAVRTWERGVGETLACGSGAVAAAAVAHRDLGLGEQVHVELLGGPLIVDVGADPATITGPAEYVFSGELNGR